MCRGSRSPELILSVNQESAGLLADKRMQDTLDTYHEAKAVSAVLALGRLSLGVESVVILAAHVQQDLHHHDCDERNTGHCHVAVAEKGAEIDFPGPWHVQKVVERSVRGLRQHKLVSV